MNKNVIWKPVLNYEGLYEVSNYGQIKSLNWYSHKGLEHLLTPQITKKGYYRIVLYKDKVVKSYAMHRLVFEAFNGVIPEKMQINHKNEIKTDNRLENLEVCDGFYNNNYGTKCQRLSEKLKNHPNISRPILQYDKSKNFIKEYPSMAEAARIVKGKLQNIYQCANGKRKSAYGSIWEYKEESHRHKLAK